MDPAAAQLPLVCAAFGLALWRYGREGGGRRARFACALLAGVGASRAGWWALHGSGASRLLAPEAGFSALFLPAGLLALAREPAAFRALCPALALARLGCVAAGCCTGAAGEPVAACEAALLLGLCAGLRRLPPQSVLPGFLLAFGSMRLAEMPWRAPLDGEAALPAAGVAAGWGLVGAGWGAARAVTARRRSRHASVTRSRGRLQTAGGG